MIRSVLPLLLLGLAFGYQQVSDAHPVKVTSAAPTSQPCLANVIRDLQAKWLDNAVVNIVAFGHSVPAGYGATPILQKRDAYPRLLEDALSISYPHAVLNVITEGVGGENSQQGLARFQRGALDHHPRVVLIDYGLNDRALTLQASARNLATMADAARAAGACPILLTPTWDTQAAPDRSGDALREQAAMIRQLGARLKVPVADSLAAFEAFGGDHAALMAQSNHPNRNGHLLVLQRLLPLFVPASAQP